MFSRDMRSEADFDVQDQVKIRPPYLKYQKENEGRILSPYFDLIKQEIVDPKHMPELISEIRFSTKIALFESEFICKRL